MKPPFCSAVNPETGHKCALYKDHLSNEHKSDHLKESWTDEKPLEGRTEAPRGVSAGVNSAADTA